MTIIRILLLVLLVSYTHAAAQEDASTDQEETAKKYRWLFDDKEEKPPPSSELTTSSQSEKIEREVKHARRLYLGGEPEAALSKYYDALRIFEKSVDEAAFKDPGLPALENQLGLFDEMVLKVLGALTAEPDAKKSAALFLLMEKKRLCRRNLLLKKVGPLRYFDVPASLLQDELEFRAKLLEVRQDTPSTQNRKAEAAILESLDQLHTSSAKSSPQHAILRSMKPMNLDEVRALLGPEEMILDFALLPDRALVGVITKDKAVYHQAEANRTEIDKEVFKLLDGLKDHYMGAGETFMGHGWKEPARRIYLMLFGKLPPLPEKSGVFIIPDRSLFYLPWATIADAEDKPLGKDRAVSIIPSVDALKLLRSRETKRGDHVFIIESIPWIAEEEVATEKKATRSSPKQSTEDKLEKLILGNPVYPKPSDLVAGAQKTAAKSEVWVGPTAAPERVKELASTNYELGILAVPVGVTDSVAARKPTVIFSPSGSGARKFEAHQFFESPIRTNLMLMPVVWYEVEDRANPTGAGPLLLTWALLYSGVNSFMLNFSDPTWGAPDPFVTAILRAAAEKKSAAQAATHYSRELSAYSDSAFSGKPPSWAGWIMFGDPR